MQRVIFYYYVVVNLVTFFLFMLDKQLAKRGLSRISEKKLHTFSLAGGVVGAVFAMLLFRHKTSKQEFLLKELFIVVLWGVVTLLYFLEINPLNFLS